MRTSASTERPTTTLPCGGSVSVAYTPSPTTSSNSCSVATSNGSVVVVVVSMGPTSATVRLPARTHTHQCAILGVLDRKLVGDRRRDHVVDEHRRSIIAPEQRCHQR